MTCPKKMTFYSYAKHELHIDATKELFYNSHDWVENILKSPNCPKLGEIKDIKFRFGHLKIQEPLQHKKYWVLAAVILYYLIGYFLMVSKVIYKNRHGNQLISWPYALWRAFRAVKK